MAAPGRGGVVKCRDQAARLGSLPSPHSSGRVSAVDTADRRPVFDHDKPGVKHPGADQLKTGLRIARIDRLAAGVPQEQGKIVIRSRSTRPRCIMLFTRVILPIERSGSADCCFRARTCSARSPRTRRVLPQASGSWRVLEKTTFGSSFIRALTSSVADEDNSAIAS